MGTFYAACSAQDSMKDGERRFTLAVLALSILVIGGALLTAVPDPW